MPILPPETPVSSQKAKGKNIALIAFICGILTFITMCGQFGVISMIFSIPAVVTGRMAMKQYKNGGIGWNDYKYAKIGFFIGVISLSLSLLGLIIFGSFKGLNFLLRK